MSWIFHECRPSLPRTLLWMINKYTTLKEQRMADTLSKKNHKLSCLLGLGSSLYVTFVSITSSYMVLYCWCGCLSCCCKITGGKIKTPKKSFHPLSRLINRPHYTENLSWNVSYSVKLPLHQCSQWDDMPFFGGRAILRSSIVVFVVSASHLLYSYICTVEFWPC